MITAITGVASELRLTLHPCVFLVMSVSLSSYAQIIRVFTAALKSAPRAYHTRFKSGYYSRLCIADGSVVYPDFSREAEVFSGYFANKVSFLGCFTEHVRLGACAPYYSVEQVTIEGSVNLGCFSCLNLTPSRTDTVKRSHVCALLFACDVEASKKTSTLNSDFVKCDVFRAG